MSKKSRYIIGIGVIACLAGPLIYKNSSGPSLDMVVTNPLDQISPDRRTIIADASWWETRAWPWESHFLDVAEKTLTYDTNGVRWIQYDDNRDGKTYRSYPIITQEVENKIHEEAKSRVNE